MKDLEEVMDEEGEYSFSKRKQRRNNLLRNSSYENPKSDYDKMKKGLRDK
jgi:hypothetical protein